MLFHANDSDCSKATTASAPLSLRRGNSACVPPGGRWLGARNLRKAGRREATAGNRGTEKHLSPSVCYSVSQTWSELDLRGLRALP